MLLPIELHEYRRGGITKAAKKIFNDLGGQKHNFSPESGFSEESNKEISKRRELLLDRLKYRRVSKKGDLCRIDVDSRCNLLKLVKARGRTYRHMGYSDPDHGYLLYPEEALLLMDLGSAQIYSYGVPLALNEAMSIMHQRFELSSSHYVVYSKLIRSGYVVRRFRKLESHEHRSRMQLTLKDTDAINARMDFDYVKSLIPNDKGHQIIKLKQFDLKRLAPFAVGQSADGSSYRLYESVNRSSPSAYNQAPFKKQNWSYIDDVRQMKKKDFYRPKSWIRFEAHRISSWSEYKAERTKLIEQRSAELNARFLPAFDVFRSTSNFAITNPGKPLCHLVVLSVEDETPDNDSLRKLELLVGGNSIQFAIVDGSEVTFLQLNLCSVPSIIP